MIKFLSFVFSISASVEMFDGYVQPRYNESCDAIDSGKLCEDRCLQEEFKIASHGWIFRFIGFCGIKI